MAVRHWMLAAVAVVAANAGAFAQKQCGGGGGGGGQKPMHCSPGGTSELRSGGGGPRTSELRGNPGGRTSQMVGTPGGYSQLSTQQQMYLQAQLQARQQAQTAALMSGAASQGYAAYAREYAAYKKRQRELRTTTVADLIAERK